MENLKKAPIDGTPPGSGSFRKEESPKKGENKVWVYAIIGMVAALVIYLIIK